VLPGAILLLLLALCASAYVYGWRGKARWRSLTEYVRKGWPFLALFNCLLYLCTQRRAQRPVMDVRDFSELAPIAANWPVIRAEALALYRDGYFSATSQPGTAAYYDLGFRTFYKYGWSKFYLRWYGYTHASAARLCPETVALLANLPTVNGAMFSLLPAGGKLTRHLDPLACSLRYHLGLVTPNNEQCFLNVDGESRIWRDGEAFLFDETYLHFARNDSAEDRLILMCDIERPMNFIGRTVNAAYKGLARLTVVPNLEGDRRGLVNTLFASIGPILGSTRHLKRSRPRLYRLGKFGLNLSLALGVALLVAGSMQLLGELGARAFTP
jgi:beta-hydroxylase